MSTLSFTSRAEPRVEIHVPGDSPAWLKAVVGTLRELVALNDDWDQQRAREVRAQAVVLALNLLTAVMEEDSPLMPWIVPRPNGGLQLEWHTNGHSVEVAVSPEGERFAACVGDDEWEGTLADIDRLYADIRAVHEAEATQA